MSAPVYLVPTEKASGWVDGALVDLDGPEARHAVTVRRTAAGEIIVLSDGAGRWARGPVRSVGRDQLTIEVAEHGEDPIPAVRFVLVQALAKGDRDERAVETATEYGVDEVVPWQASRSIVQWRGDRGMRSWASWDAVIVAATKQSRRTRRPVLSPTCSTADLLSRIRAGSTAYVLDEEARVPLAGVDQPSAGEVLLIVGPEGGVSDAERTAFVDAGARLVRLGPQVLRSSSAGPAAIAVLSAATRWR